MDRNRLLTIGAVLAAVVVVALGFLAGISPQLKEAATARAQNSQVVSQNDVLSAGISALEKKSENLRSLSAQLTDLQKSVPEDAASPAFIDEINAYADKASVSITGLTMDDAQAYAAPASAGAASTATGSAPAAPTAVTNSAITSANLSVIPVSVTVEGTYGQALDFVSLLHTGDRLFLVTKFTGSNESAADGTAGTWTVSGSIYALTDAKSAQKQQQTTTNSSTASSATDGSSTDTAAGK